MPYRWQATALLAVQEAAEAHLVRLFEDAYVYDTNIVLHQLTLIQKSMRHSWQTCNNNGQRHAIGSTYSW